MGTKEKKTRVTISPANMFALDALHRMLQAAGLVDRQTRANRDEECDQQQHHDDFHGETVGDWRCRVMGMDSQSKQQRCDRAAEETVEQRGEPELLHTCNPNLTIQSYDSGRSRLSLKAKDQYPRRKAA
jgi:hypothetical protein